LKHFHCFPDIISHQQKIVNPKTFIMKRKFFSAGLVLALCGGWFSMHSTQSNIVGKVAPQDAVELIWAISGQDTVKTSLVAGSFALQVKPGNYKVVIDAKDPYKDWVMENVAIAEGETRDLGEIALEQ
jgi:hypothetical protein